MSLSKVKDSQSSKVHLIFAGNPGSGKSTLLNALFGSVTFRSGVAYGKGLTSKLEVRYSEDGQAFMDTPGLSDTEMKQQAGEAIEEALRQSGKDGTTRVVFVVTLESGRLKPDDLVTMQIILKACPAIGQDYGIIINKVPPKAVEALHQNLDELLGSWTPPDGVCKSGLVLINPHDEELDWGDMVFKPASPDLLGFLDCIKPIQIQPDAVLHIDVDGLEREKEELETKTAQLQADKEGLQLEIEKYKENKQMQLQSLFQLSPEQWIELSKTVRTGMGISYKLARYAMKK